MITTILLSHANRGMYFSNTGKWYVKQFSPIALTLEDC